MLKEEYLFYVFNQFYFELDNVYERLKVKWALLSILKNNLTPVDVKIVHPETKSKILHIEYPSGKINEHYPEMEIECRRIFISDLYKSSATFSIYLDNVIREKKVNGRHLPAFSNAKYDQPLTLLNRFLNADDKHFLKFLQNIRNSMIHYDGQYNIRNSLNYKILNLEFKSTEFNIGEQIIWGLEEMIAVYHKLRYKVFTLEKFTNNPMFK